MIAVQAELTQTPFDMPIAESELVAGYMTEYSGFRFLLFFIGEFATAGVFAAHRRDAVPRRLGRAVRRFGWDSIDDDDWMNVVGPLMLFTKMMVLSVPHLLGALHASRASARTSCSSFAWKVLIPISLVNIMVTAIFKVVF